MRGWVLFALVAFLVFGVPLIDEIYRRRIRSQIFREDRVRANECHTPTERAAIDEITKPPISGLSVVLASVFILGLAPGAFADNRCQQLEALNAQYAGVPLTADQQRLKRRLVAWYIGHCGGQRANAR